MSSRRSLTRLLPKSALIDSEAGLAGPVGQGLYDHASASWLPCVRRPSQPPRAPARSPENRLVSIPDCPDHGPRRDRLSSDITADLSRRRLPLALTRFAAAAMTRKAGSRQPPACSMLILVLYCGQKSSHPRVMWGRQISKSDIRIPRAEGRAMLVGNNHSPSQNRRLNTLPFPQRAAGGRCGGRWPKAGRGCAAARKRVGRSAWRHGTQTRACPLLPASQALPATAYGAAGCREWCVREHRAGKGYPP